MDDICKSPFTGFVIGPRGEINYCCMGTQGDYFVSTIDDIENLQEFFKNSKKFNVVRDQFLNGKYSTITPCSNCYNHELSGRITFRELVNKKFPYEIKSNHIRYLEYTTSNICNATCATCNSEYSSSWIKYDKLFDRNPQPIVKLSDQSIEKIVKILPGLEWMVIKGGEPFADKNNFYILNKLFDINKSCEVSFVTNMSLLNDDHIETLKKNPGKIKIHASIDGIGKVYNWIRSTNFDIVINNMETLYNQTGIKCDITLTLSIFNYFNLLDVFDYFLDKPFIGFIVYKNVLYDPKACSIKSLPKDLFEYQKHKIISYNHEKLGIESAEYLKSISPGIENKKTVFNHIDIINQMRGFDICDYVPELKAWRG